MKIRQQLVHGKQWLPGVVMGVALAGAFFVASFVLVAGGPVLTRCNLRGGGAGHYSTPAAAAGTQLVAILHYATTRVVPQQTLAEIRVSFDVLRSLSPCNFLVFGLGHDSLMWASFNPRGNTVFLEEDPRWVQKVLKDAPFLRAHPVRYRTRLSEASDLLRYYRSEPDCVKPIGASLRRSRCRLALTTLPKEVYETEWDLIMIDAPRGYHAAAPGRMGAIFTAAVMARAGRRVRVTHVFLHDVNRRTERIYAEEFLCKKYLAKAVGRLWHFQIPPSNDTGRRPSGDFC